MLFCILTGGFSACAARPPRASSAPDLCPSAPSPAPVVATSSAQVQFDPTAPQAGERSDGRWLVAADSTFRAPSPVTPRCLSVVGCPFTPALIPSCAPTARGTSFTSPTELTNAIGSRLTLRGSLQTFARSTLVDCGERCCNGASGAVALVAGTPRDEASSILLVDPDRPSAFQCQGDESKVCCGVEDARDVLVQGTLVRDQTRLELRDPKLCRLADTG